MRPSDHDASYKLLFSAPELVRDLVLGFIPDEWLHSLDYATLEKMPGSYISDDMRHRADELAGSVHQHSQAEEWQGWHKAGPCHEAQGVQFFPSGCGMLGGHPYDDIR